MTLSPQNSQRDYTQIFEQTTPSSFPKGSLEEILLEEHVEICQDFDASYLQESWSWRNVYRARRLANALLDEKGNLVKKEITKALQILQKNGFSIGPERHHDAVCMAHLRSILTRLLKDPSLERALKSLVKPEVHEGISRLIRETIQLSESKALTDRDVRQAALSALFTLLRQNVGSCFATAPAILIQQEQPLRFFEDLQQLLGRGQLTRVVAGTEFTVPISLSWGMGDLLRPIPLSLLGEDPLKTLSRSPGLHAAFASAQLLSKKHDLYTVLKKSHFIEKLQDPFSPITADQVIKAVLLDVFGVTSEQVTHFQERPIQGFAGEILIQAPLTQGEKTLACSRYLKAYEQAKIGFKSLTDHPLLKAWEFTLASLSESKADFAKWNLYISLGVQPEDPHGIGQSLYLKIQEQIELLNQEIEENQSNYEHLFAQVKYLEGRISRASTENEAGWVRAEYQMRKHEIHRALVQRDNAYNKGKDLQSIYAKLIEFYGRKIRDYFQEVYDPQMLDVSASLYDDSPAGFRLLYKHGRANTALWTLVHSPGEYIQHLTSFFISTEVDLESDPEFEGLKRELSELIRVVINTIKGQEFLESSIKRLARAYKEPLIKDPLNNLERVQRKPWAYISGGTMNSLISCYWQIDREPKEAARWVENETELLAFLIDTVKELPRKVQQLFLNGETSSLLCFSPTHAFVLKPRLPLFQKAWQSDLYTYTWIRDQLIFPCERFLAETLLDGRMINRILQELLLFIPKDYRGLVTHALKGFTFSMTAPEFREQVLKTLAYEKWLREGRGLELILEELDSILLRFLPLFPEHQLEENLRALFSALPECERTVHKNLSNLTKNAARYQIWTAEDLKRTALSLIMSSYQTTRFSLPLHQRVVEAMQAEGLSYPAPLLFADTNWVNHLFGFTLSPGTGSLELWRFEASGFQGRPMSSWKPYVNGVSRKEWGVLINPLDYGQEI